MKRTLFSVALIGTMAALIGCGPADFTGSQPNGAPDSLIDRDGDAPIDTTQYEWVSYDFIFSVFTDTLGMTFQGPTDDPENAPLDYLDARKAQVGASDYNDSLPDNAVTGAITAPGYKTLIFAGSSACGLAMEQGKYAELFPNGLDSLDTLYLTLLSRYPTTEEIAVHEAMWNDMQQTWSDMLDYEAANPGTLPQADIDKYTAAVNDASQADMRKAGASCAVVLTSMEFLTVN